VFDVVIEGGVLTVQRVGCFFVRFEFHCHRKKEKFDNETVSVVRPVNLIDFHENSTFMTGGTCNLW